MAIKLNAAYLDSFVSKEQLAAMNDEVCCAYDKVVNGTGEGADFLGWRDLPVNYDKEEFGRIKAAAEKIKKICDVFIVIGIGGSYLGARAAVEFVKSSLYNSVKKDTPDIYFAGNTLSSAAVSELLEICAGKDVCINVISKSGTTTEPALAFRIFRKLLEEKYGVEGSKERIFVTTDKSKGKLKELATEMSYESFVVPDDIGGRYSVLTAVGLLPIAVAGIDIDDMMAGAVAAREEFLNRNFESNDCMKYVAIRNFLYRNGKKIEVFASYDSAVTMVAEWWKQLYGESEGKDGKGIYPSSAIFSTDLHSLGQIIQEGERTLFETVLNIKKAPADLTVENDPENLDGLNFVAGSDMSEINHKAFLATVLAHSDGGVPNIVIDIDGRTAYDFGTLVYFFELACGISGYVLGVNPFNQPGVEAYKKNMYALLGKPGYEELKAELESRIG